MGSFCYAGVVAWDSYLVLDVFIFGSNVKEILRFPVCV